MNVGQEAPVCACSNRWAERAAGRAGGCGQQLRAERCCRAEHAAGGQKADGRAGAAACRGWSARVRGRVRRARVARLLDLHLLLLRGAVAVVVVVSDCHRNVPSCARNSLSRSLSLSLACAVRSIACSLAFSLLSLSLSLHCMLRVFNGLTLHSLAYASSAFFSSPSASSSLPTSRSPSGSAIDTTDDAKSCQRDARA